MSDRLRAAAERMRGLTFLTFAPGLAGTAGRSVLATNIRYAERCEEATIRVRRVCAAAGIDAESVLAAAGGDLWALEDAARRIARNGW